MSSIWTVKSEQVKLDLVYTEQDGGTHPFSIWVKKYLTVGEERRIITAGWRGMASKAGQGTEISIDWRAQTFARTEAWLRDWTLADETGEKLKLNMDTIQSLAPEVYDIIEQAITVHVEAIAEEKKLKTGSGSPSAT